jgi:hypothetical protein
MLRQFIAYVAFFMLAASSSFTNALTVSRTTSSDNIGLLRSQGVETVVVFNLFCEFVLPFLKSAQIEVHPDWCAEEKEIEEADGTNINTGGEGAGLEESDQLGGNVINSNELIQGGIGR